MRELGKVFQLNLIPSRSSISLHWSFNASKSMLPVDGRVTAVIRGGTVVRMGSSQRGYLVHSVQSIIQKSVNLA